MEIIKRMGFNKNIGDFMKKMGDFIKKWKIL